MISYASNAVLSKARAMYAKRMTLTNYNDLMSSKGIPDIVNYLQGRTYYSQVLSECDEKNVHRGRLEFLLKHQMINDFMALGKYDLAVGEHFFEYIISRIEIENLIKSLMLLMSKQKLKYAYEIPEFFRKHTKINLLSLYKVDSFSQFLEIIKNSKYYDIISPFQNKFSKTIDLIGIENVLYIYLYKTLFKIINDYVKNPQKKQLNDFFSTYIDLVNYVKIIRLKKYYNVKDEYIYNVLLPFGNVFKNRTNLISNKDSKQILRELKASKLGAKWFYQNLDTIDKIPENFKFQTCKHNIRFSVYPPIVMLSYIFLKEIEILNIINIIESVRYQVSKEEINKKLIL